jgi:hypothetical protein
MLVIDRLPRLRIVSSLRDSMFSRALRTEPNRAFSRVHFNLKALEHLIRDVLCQAKGEL